MFLYKINQVSTCIERPLNGLWEKNVHNFYALVFKTYITLSILNFNIFIIQQI